MVRLHHMFVLLQYRKVKIYRWNVVDIIVLGMRTSNCLSWLCHHVALSKSLKCSAKGRTEPAGRDAS